MAKKLATIKAIDKAERQLIARLKRYFASGLLAGHERHLELGIERVTEQAALARTLLHHMQERDIPDVETLAHKMWFDGDMIEYIDMLRYPTSFGTNADDKDDADYLLSLCGLEIEIEIKEAV